MSAGLIALLLTQMLYVSSSIPKEFCSDWKYMYSLSMEDDSFQKEHDLLEVAVNFQRLVTHPCNQNVALHVRKMVFFTRDGFQSSLYPLKFPKAFKVIKTQLTAAEFVEDHVVMLISENIYIYYPNNKSWTPAKGINVRIDGISTNQCCIKKESFCKTISSLVIAYHKSVNISEVSIFLSTNGGLDFEEIRPEMPSETDTVTCSVRMCCTC
ncbi:cation channel sperm-associated auxiliary subunit delta-like [Hemitrygon akajei]|uniref:cation channel sperm-associated auxiliary subunit delta-like n=1 Tax=Hemitrygon akajei TaxID=2704970 RepID=UPI003BF95815